jgi:transcriptional regulator with XRE-family HTH domain
MESIEVGERIRKLRTDREMSQVALASLIGLNPQTVRDYESGRRMPTIKGLPLLAKALDVSISELIEGSDEAPPIKRLPVSQTLKMLASIPDDVYELAQGVSLKDEAWETVRMALETAREREERKRKNKSV